MASCMPNQQTHQCGQMAWGWYRRKVGKDGCSMHVSMDQYGCSYSCKEEVMH